MKPQLRPTTCVLFNKCNWKTSRLCSVYRKLCSFVASVSDCKSNIPKLTDHLIKHIIEASLYVEICVYTFWNSSSQTHYRQTPPHLKLVQKWCAIANLYVSLKLLPDLHIIATIASQPMCLPLTNKAALQDWSIFKYNRFFLF